MIVVVDNYDSFTYNLVQYLGEQGVELIVARNDTITVDEVREMKPAGIVISPGPGVPSRAGISVELIRHLHTSTPILGVCLGHQAIGEAFGGRVVKAERIMHGKTSSVFHSGEELFRGIPSPFTATRYHSLVVAKDSLPSSLMLTAWTADGVVMGIRHRDVPTFGIQFHPESFATDHGKQILRNFLVIR